MKRLIVIFGIMAAFLALKSLIMNKKQSSHELMPKIGISKPIEGNCMRMDKFLYEHPDASPEEIDDNIQCNKERAAHLGLDKPSTGFLGNTRSRPDGALAHYEGSGGRMFFTVYTDHILSSESKGHSESIKIPFAKIKKVKKGWEMPGINVEYENEHGNIMQHSIILIFGSDEMLKAEGATDLDRLIALMEKQRLEFQ